MRDGWIVITGGAGFLGRKLAMALADIGLGERLLLVDQVPAPPPGLPGVCRAIDLTAPGGLDGVIDADTAAIVHLAAVVSAAAEADFDLGLRVNLDLTRALIGRAREAGSRPRFIFASSVAVFGDAPALVVDETPAVPRSSYGTQKVMAELLIADATRKGFVDGRSVRLPTVSIRPGRPNKAASSFASSILREPLNGEGAVCPVAEDLGLWLSSPRAVTASLVHALTMDEPAWGAARVLNLPGISVTVAEMLAGLARAGGDPELVRFEPDESVRAIVGTWPAAMATTRAHALGFRGDTGVDALIAGYLADDAPTR